MMKVALAPSEPDACANDRRPLHHIRADRVLLRPVHAPTIAQPSGASNRTIAENVQGTRP